MASLISSTTWIRRGVPAQHPKKYTLDQKELERVSRMAGSRLAQVKDLLEAQVEAEEDVNVEDMITGETEDEELEDNPSELLTSHPHQIADGEWTDEDSPRDDMDIDTKVDCPAPDHPTQEANDDLAQYNLDKYDEEESKGVSMGAFSNVKGLQYYQDPSEDPYITLENKNEDDTAEREELEIYPTDNLLVAAKTEDGVSQLDIYVYDESQENIYVHHDILLPAMPLCLEWIDFTPAGLKCEDSSRKGNFIAVGTMDPDIEIWNLDIIDGLYPDAILGANCPDQSEQAASQPESNRSSKKMKKKTKKKLQASSKPELTSQIFPTHHSSSVLSLSHNKLVRNLLLSSSADTTIKLWDLNVAPTAPSSTFTAIRSFGLHDDKVQSAQWNPKEPSVVLSGGWDSLIKVWDSRNSSEGVHVKVGSDVECLRWDPFHPQAFIVSLDNGLIQSYDSRMLSNFTDSTPQSKPLWTLSAHDSSVSAMDMSPIVPGLLITGGTDKMVKVWNLAETSGTPSLSMVVARDLGVGKVFSVGFCPDDATTVAVAGSKASLQIWDLATNDGVRSIFGERLKQHAHIDPQKRKTIGNGGVLGVVDDIETDDEDC